jgi:hypothetical protein
LDRLLTLNQKLNGFLSAASGRAFWGRFFFDRLQRLQVVSRQFNWPLAPAPSPLIAFNAADKTLTVVVDFDQRLIALFAAIRWH